jgi:hypothetical protein
MTAPVAAARIPKSFARSSDQKSIDLQNRQRRMSSIASPVLRTHVHDPGRRSLRLQFEGRYKGIVPLDDDMPNLPVVLKADCELHVLASSTFGSLARKRRSRIVDLHPAPILLYQAPSLDLVRPDKYVTKSSVEVSLGPKLLIFKRPPA